MNFIRKNKPLLAISSFAWGAAANAVPNMSLSFFGRCTGALSWPVAASAVLMIAIVGSFYVLVIRPLAKDS